jgi:ribonuclease P protein component
MLKKPAEFERVMGQGRGMRGRTATVRILDRADGGLPRFGFAVSRKIGGAVERNRIKRRWREVARSVGMSVRSGVDCVVMPRPDAGTASFAACREDLWSMMQALGTVGETAGLRDSS